MKPCSCITKKHKDVECPVLLLIKILIYAPTLHSEPRQRFGLNVTTLASASACFWRLLLNDISFRILPRNARSRVSLPPNRGSLWYIPIHAKDSRASASTSSSSARFTKNSSDFTRNDVPSASPGHITEWPPHSPAFRINGVQCIDNVQWSRYRIASGSCNFGADAF
jgi:hypothetical protein